MKDKTSTPMGQLNKGIELMYSLANTRDCWRVGFANAWIMARAMGALVAHTTSAPPIDTPPCVSPECSAADVLRVTNCHASEQDISLAAGDVKLSVFVPDGAPEC